MEKKINSELEIKYKDKFVIATLSRFDVQKNMGLMYEIASKIKNHINIQFIFIGDGDDKLILEQKAKK